jgi:hypothetical protein
MGRDVEVHVSSWLPRPSYLLSMALERQTVRAAGCGVGPGAAWHRRLPWRRRRCVGSSWLRSPELIYARVQDFCGGSGVGRVCEKSVTVTATLTVTVRGDGCFCPDFTLRRMRDAGPLLIPEFLSTQHFFFAGLGGTRILYY